MLRPGLIACLLLASLPASATSTSPGPGFALSIGSYATTQTYEGGGTTAFFGSATLEYRGRYAFGGVPFGVDAWAMAAPGFSPALSSTSLSFAVRARLDYEHIRVALGPVINLAPGSPNLAQWLPSLTLKAGTWKWAGVLGLFDRPEQPILRAGAEFVDQDQAYSLAYVLLGGAEVSGHWRIAGPLWLDARVLVSRQPMGNGLGAATIGISTNGMRLP